jgi:hypothetical protein
MKQIIILFSIIFVVLATVCGVLLYIHPQDNTSNENITTQNNNISWSMPSLKYQYNVGDSFFYSVKYAAKTFLEDPSKTNSFYEIEIQGRLRQNTYNVQEKKAYIGYAFESPIVTMTNMETDYSKETIEKILKQEIFIVKDEHGRIEQWFFPQTIPESLRNNMKSLLCNLQVIFKDSDSTDWENQEEDANGKYNARYKATKSATSNSLVLFKRKIKYINEDTKQNLKIIKSQATIDFKIEGNYIASMTVQEELASDAMNIHTQGVSNISYKFERKEFDPLLGSKINKQLHSDTMYSTTSFKPEGEKHFRENRYKRLLNNRTWQDLEAEFKKMLENPSEVNRYDLFQALIAWASLNPDQLYRLSKLILTNEKMDSATSMLCGVLSHAEVPEAQDALINIIDQRNDDATFEAMTVSYLGQVKEPTDSTIQKLQELTNIENDVTPIANLALGSVIGKLKTTDPARANALIYDFETKLQNEQTIEKQGNYLETLGNAGSVSSLRSIEPFLKNSDYGLRAKAYSSLRFINDEAAERLLAKGLLEEPHHHVKSNILEAMQYRNNGEITYNALVEMIGRETNNQHKITEAGLLWKMRKAFPQAESIVRQYSTSDTSIKVRNAIRSIILTDPR